MNAGDIFSIIVRGTVLQQLTVNVFHYKVGVPGAFDGADILGEFRNTVQAAWQAVIDEAAFWSSHEVNQVTGGGDYYVEPIVVQGAAMGDCLPPSTCWTFRYGRTQLGRRHGYKRIAGVCASQVANGVATGPASILLETLAIQFGLMMSFGNGSTFIPVVLHKMLNGQPVTPPVAWDISGVEYTHVGTQNTRKFGRGA